MKKLLTTLTLALIFSQSSFAADTATIQFLCGSENDPAFEFPINSNGSVDEVSNGQFGEQVLVSEFHLRNGDVKVELNPFHAYCSVGIEYVNHTNSVFNSSGDVQFSETAKIAMSCEGGPVQYRECLVEVK